MATANRVRDDRKTPIRWVEEIRQHWADLVLLKINWRKGRADYTLLCDFPMVVLEDDSGSEGSVFDIGKAAIELADSCWGEVVSYAESDVPRGDYQLVGYGYGEKGNLDVLFEIAKQCWLDSMVAGSGEENDSPTQGAMRALTVALADARNRAADADKRAADYHGLAMEALKAAPGVINGGTEVLNRGVALMGQATELMEEASTLRAEAKSEWQSAKRWDAEVEQKRQSAEKFASVAHHTIDVMGGEMAKGALLVAQIFAEREGIDSQPAPSSLQDACDQLSDSITVKQHTVLSADCSTDLFSVLEACSKMETDREAAHALTAFLATYRAEFKKIEPFATPRQQSLLRFIDGEISRHFA